LAACYALVGQICCCDTGDYHLMLSVGGKVLLTSPDESEKLGYIYSELHYQPNLWKNEEIRVRYINHNTGELIYKYD
jgi:hypothetical protein